MTDQATEMAEAIDRIAETHGGWRKQSTRGTFIVRGALLVGYHEIEVEEVAAVFQDLYEAMIEELK